MMTRDNYPRTKNWKLVYTRSNKLHRAKQLGFEYPRISEFEMVNRQSLKVLFVCSMNQWRSPTAEKVFADRPLVLTRSCGTNTGARKKMNSDDLQWADIILVMEQKHKQRLLATFPGELRFKEVYVLDIPDNYKFMDTELIDELVAVVDPILTQNA